MLPSRYTPYWASHKDGEDVNDMFNIGNKMRAAEGKSPANITYFVNSKATQDFITNLPPKAPSFRAGRMSKSGRCETAVVS